MAKHLIVELDMLLLKNNKSSNDIARVTGHTKANVSRIRTGKIKAIRFTTLMDICEELDCQPGDLLRIVTDEELERLVEERRRNAQARGGPGSNRRSLPKQVYVVDLSDEY